jgi:hypothetical protein
MLCRIGQGLMNGIERGLKILRERQIGSDHKRGKNDTCMDMCAKNQDQSFKSAANAKTTLFSGKSEAGSSHRTN